MIDQRREHGTMRRALLIFRAVSGVTFVAAVVACGAGADSVVSAVVRDSAGVTIVENPGDVWSGTRTWRLSDSAVVRIGAVDGPAEQLFGRISHIVALGDGSVVVADAASNTLRWFDRDGRFLFRRGGEGGGPGEFRRISSAEPADGDTLVVSDTGTGRITLYGPDGSLGPMVSALGLYPYLAGVFRLSDGSFISNAPPIDLLASGERPAPGLMRDRVPLVRIEADGSGADTVGIFAGNENMVSFRPDGRLRKESPYFSRGTHYAAQGDRVLVAPNDPFVVDVYGPDGALRRSVRAPDVDLELDDEVIGAFRSFMIGRLDGIAEDRRAELIRDLDDRMASMLLPPGVPAYSQLRIDPDGNMWLAEYRFELNLHPPDRWLVLDRDGRFVSVVAMPQGFVLFAAARDRVYGVTRDSLDVQYVTAYAIERTQAPAGPQEQANTGR